ncbi:glycoside hydrolase family 172 protein [Lacticaseibacillus daqingensis]|uniref:glycoside hydrolase family 172 protein n=1 Tax=Lacticaseibacillus daqingensis TaxID=2486014 RepID=UPI000F7981CB|nr:glycoside hydrolase family 172 protein [Lacticaseibacillus daqingensis]
MSLLSDITQYRHQVTRAITPENITGEKGAAAQAGSKLGPHRKGSPTIPLMQGEETELANIEGPGVIQHIWMTVRNQTELGSFVLRDLVLRFYWDDEPEPAVVTPLGDFFCNGFGQWCDVNSLPIVVNPTGGFNSYFEMPFKHHARITIENQHPKSLSSFFYTINYALVDGLPDNSMYFHAKWQRERCTKKAVDYTLLDTTEGPGVYVGTYLALTALQRYWWGEGEFKFYIDEDDQLPTVTSTGSEDYFGGAWAFHDFNHDGHPRAKNFCTPFLGYPYQSTRDSTRDRFETGKLNAIHAFGDDALPQHGLYRWHLQDPIVFEHGLKVALQQIGNDDVTLFEREDDVASVAYWYALSPAGDGEALPDRTERLPR